MIDNLFYRLHSEKLSDWGVVLLGISGVAGLNERLSHSAVREFANEELKNISINDPVLHLVVDVATNIGNTSADVRKMLEEICQEKRIDFNKSERKWRYIILLDLLSDIVGDSLYGLIKLSEFWDAWGWPNDRPSSMQDDDGITSHEYHSKENYDLVIANHWDWLNSEIKAIET